MQYIVNPLQNEQNSDIVPMTELIPYKITQLIYKLKRYKITITDNFIIIILINRQVYLIFFLSGETIM